MSVLDRVIGYTKNLNYLIAVEVEPGQHFALCQGSPGSVTILSASAVTVAVPVVVIVVSIAIAATLLGQVYEVILSKEHVGQSVLHVGPVSS